MDKINLGIHIAVFSIAPETYVPDRLLPLPDGVTHFVDLISFSHGDMATAKLAYLDGTYDPMRNTFTFSDRAMSRLKPKLVEAFGSNLTPTMLELLQNSVVCNIAAALVIS